MSHHEHSAPIPPKLAILLVFFCLGELGESLNIMEGIYLVDIGWHEGSVGLALSLLGLTALIVQPWAGDLVDKTSHDRRLFLVVASIVMAMSASAIFLVREGNYSADHFLIYGFKIMEGIASSFVFPCITALTLATFGPGGFDEVMAVILIWGHMGSVVMTLVTGVAAYFLYPKTMYCFLVGGVTALLAACFVPFVSEGDPLLGRGFQRKEVAVDSNGYRLQRDIPDGNALDITCKISPEAASYLDIVTDKKTCILCFTGFFYQ